MPRLNIAVRGLFARPVAAVALPDAAARNLELSEIILRRRAGTASIQASSAGGWHSDRQGQKTAPKWTVQAWANVNGPGDGNISHYHSGSFWSGTHYIDNGGCTDDPAFGGELELLDPRGAG